MEPSPRPRLIASLTAVLFLVGSMGCRGRVISTSTTTQWETDPQPIREQVVDSSAEVEISSQIGFADPLDVDHEAGVFTLFVTTETVHTEVRTEKVEVAFESRERELGSRTRKGNQTPGECFGAIMLGTLAVIGTVGLIALVDAARNNNPDDDDLTFPGCPDDGFATASAGGGGGGRGDGPCARHEWMETIDRIVDTRDETSVAQRIVRGDGVVHSSMPVDGGWFTFTGDLIPGGTTQVVSRKGGLTVPFEPTYPTVLASSQDRIAAALDLDWLDESCRLTAMFHIANHATAGVSTLVVTGEAPDEQGNLTVRGSKTYEVPVWIAPLPNEVLELCEGG